MTKCLCAAYRRPPEIDLNARGPQPPQRRLADYAVR